MANVLLAWPNRVETTALSGGSYLQTLPLSNAKNKVLAKRARTTDTLETSTRFDCLFTEGKPVNVVAIASHNFTTQALWRVRLFSTTSLTGLVYDSGYVKVWPALYATEDLEWEYNNWWEGTIQENQRQDFTPLAFNIDMGLNIALSMSIDIKDTTNPDGYLEFGRVFIGEGFTPKINMVYGASMGYEENSLTEITLNNTEYFDVRKPRRTASFQINALDKNESFTKIYQIQRQIGIHSDVFFSYDSESTQEVYLRSFLGRMQSISPISQPYIDRYETSFNLIEIL